MKLLQWTRDSLAGRLSVYFGLGTLLILAALGSLVVAIVEKQIEQRDVRELQSKTASVQKLLQTIRGPRDINPALRIIRDTEVGHADLSVGLWLDDQWLLKPVDALARHAERRFEGGGDAALSSEELYATERYRRIRYLTHTLDLSPTVTLAAVVAIDVTETKALLNRLLVTLTTIGLAGAALIALLTWWATTSGLAPLKRVALEAERMTAQALGRPLSVSEAPIEVRGMVSSVNEMLGRLQKSFSSLEQFSADIAHELRTPVNALLTQTQVTLSRDRSSDEYRETLHLSLEELNRLQRMVTNMLFIARAEQGVSQAIFEVVDLLVMVREVVEYLELAASEKGQTIEVRGDLSALADPLMLRRAVTNLLSNAVRYAPGGTGILVAMNVRDDLACIEVSNDYSVAMSQEQLNRMFDRFSRGDTTTRDDADGLGLGLSIVRSVMRLHGGSVHASQAAGKVRIHLFWPLRQ